MNYPLHALTVETESLQGALQHVFDNYFERRQRIVRIERQPSPYRSSFSLEEVQVHFESGEQYSLIFKNLGWSSLSESARKAKHESLYNPEREVFVYRKILSQSDLGTATFYGSCIAASPRRYWLFLARVPGTELYQIGDFSIWCRVARWLAGAHCRLGETTSHLSNVELATLLNYNEHYYGDCLTRAVTIHADLGLKRIADRYSVATKQLVGLPRTCIHGEFYPSNVLIQGSGEQAQVCPVDWESAAIGPGLMDLAALVAGKWNREQRLELARNYYAALVPRNPWSNDWSGFLNALAYCRLHVAVQWLGSSPTWTPPSEHSHDWHSEALQLADDLRL